MLDFSTARTVTARGFALPESPEGEPALVLRSIEGEEALSEIYEYTLDMMTPEGAAMLAADAANLDLRKMIGQELTVTIQLDGMGTFVPGAAGAAGSANVGAGTREISGIVTRAHFVEQQNRQSHYRLSLQPWIWLADQRSDYRIFQHRSVIEIIREVLSAYRYTCAWRTSRIYPRLPYQVQYGETDFHFIQRLTQENGIYWFFEHSKTFHRMVFVDHVGAHEPVHSAAYHTLSYYSPRPRIDAEYVDAFDMSQQLQSGVWTTSDYDFMQPRADLEARKVLPQHTIDNDLERYEWPGDYTDPADGAQFALMRIEEIFARGERAQGTGNLRNVVCGTTFHLRNHPCRAANQEYLVIRSRLRAHEIGETTGMAVYAFRTQFAVQPARNVFRPARTAIKPRTRGPQTAVVTGYAGNVVSTDRYGRVTLKFRWDRSPVNDASSSCWVRVMTPWAGGAHGDIGVPRVGTEVVVDFENGDPDRPLVIGQAYNGAHLPPWPLQNNHALSGKRSVSLDGGQSNQFVVDDTPGELQAQITSDHANSRLVLGYNTRIVPGAGRQDSRGEGWELATDSWGVLRANRGMLITTETRHGAQNSAKDMGETVARLARARDQHDSFAQLAQRSEAQEADGDQRDVADALGAQIDQIRGGGAEAGPTAGFPELSTPHLILASPAGIEATTPHSTHLASGDHIALTSGRHLSMSVGGRFLASVIGGVRLFCQRFGIRLIAASVDIDIRALKDSIGILAKLDITHTANRITITAKEEVLINGGGSYTRWKASGVETGTDGSWLVHAGGRSLAGPKSLPVAMPMLPGDVCIECLLKRALHRSALVNKGS